MLLFPGHSIAEHESALVNRLARQIFPQIETNKEKAYTLEEQINHKVQFIKQYLHKTQNIILMAHSQGSYMTLSLLQRISKEYNIVRVILLFPVFERTMETTKGKKFVPRFQNFRHSLIRTGHVIENLPNILRESIYSIAEQRYKADNANAMKKAMKALLTPTCARNIAQMLDDLSQFGDHSKFSNIFKDFGERLTLYYGSDDAWTPLTYGKRLSENYPLVDVRVDEHEIQHCFVLESCFKLSKIVASMIDLRKIDCNVRVIKVRSQDENENLITGKISKQVSIEINYYIKSTFKNIQKILAFNCWHNLEKKI